jgi:hypothetical protein
MYIFVNNLDSHFIKLVLKIYGNLIIIKYGATLVCRIC